MSDKSSGKCRRWIKQLRPDLEKACRENGLEWQKGGQDGKAPTRALFLARLYLADAGAEPDTAMEAEMHEYMLDKNTNKDALFANLKKIDPNTTLTTANKCHDMALSIARVVANRQSQPSTNDEGKQPAAADMTKQSNLQPSGDLEMGGAQDGESYAFAAAEPNIFHGMGDAHLSNLSMEGLGLGSTSPSRTHDRPSPSSSTKVQMEQVKRHKLDGARIPGWRAGSSSQDAAGSSAHATGHTVGSAAQQLSTSQSSQKGGGFLRNLFGSSSKPQEEFTTGASFTGIGQGNGHEQAAQHIGNTVLQLITTHDGIAGLLSEYLASNIRQDAASKAHSANEELQIVKKTNGELNDKIQELEEELDSLQKRHEEILEAARQRENDNRAVLDMVQRVLTEWGEARTRDGNTSLEVLRHVRSALAGQRVTGQQ